MFTVGEFAETHTDKTETVTVIAENSKNEFAISVGYLTKLLYGVVAISTSQGARITVSENNFVAIKNYLQLN